MNIIFQFLKKKPLLIIINHQVGTPFWFFPHHIILAFLSGDICKTLTGTQMSSILGKECMHVNCALVRGDVNQLIVTRSIVFSNIVLKELPGGFLRISSIDWNKVTKQLIY